MGLIPLILILTSSSQIFYSVHCLTNIFDLTKTVDILLTYLPSTFFFFF